MCLKNGTNMTLYTSVNNHEFHARQFLCLDLQYPNTLAVSGSRANNPFSCSSSFGPCVRSPSSSAGVYFLSRHRPSTSFSYRCMSVVDPSHTARYWNSLLSENRRRLRFRRPVADDAVFCRRRMTCFPPIPATSWQYHPRSVPLRRRSQRSSCSILFGAARRCCCCFVLCVFHHWCL